MHQVFDRVHCKHRTLRFCHQSLCTFFVLAKQEKTNSFVRAHISIWFDLIFCVVSAMRILFCLETHVLGMLKHYTFVSYSDPIFCAPDFSHLSFWSTDFKRFRFCLFQLPSFLLCDVHSVFCRVYVQMLIYEVQCTPDANSVQQLSLCYFHCYCAATAAARCCRCCWSVWYISCCHIFINKMSNYASNACVPFWPCSITYREF